MAYLAALFATLVLLARSTAPVTRSESDAASSTPVLKPEMQLAGLLVRCPLLCRRGPARIPRRDRAAMPPRVEVKHGKSEWCLG